MVAGAGGGGRVKAEGGARSPAGPAGGGGGVHGAAVARVVAPGGAGAAGAVPRGGRGGALGSGSGASGWLRRRGGVGSLGAGGECAVRGGSGSAAVCGTGPHRSSRACQEVSAGPGGPRVVPSGTWGGGGPPSSMDLECRGVVAAAAGGMGGVTVPGGVGSRGPPWRGRGGRGDTVAGTGGVAPGGRWGMRVERSVTFIPYAGAVRARGVVARWGRVAGSGSGRGGVGGGGGGATGGGGAGSGGVDVACMALGPLQGIPVPLVGVGGRPSCAAPGAVLFGGQGGRVGGRA